MTAVRKYASSYFFILPFFLFYVVFTFYPIIKGFIISLYNYQILGDEIFLGFKNYGNLLKDPVFWSSLWHTTEFVLLSVPILVIFGFILALVMNAPLKGRTLYRAVIFSPMILSVSAISSIWQAILGSYGGLVNTVLHAFGVYKELFWLADPKLAWVSILVITVWWTVGFNMILYLAGLQDIPSEYYEAAEIDGASRWAQLRYITIPCLNKVTLLVVFLQIISSFKVFAQVYLVTGGGPAGATRTLIQYIYEKSFNQFLFGPGAAISYLLFLILIIVSISQLKLLNKVE